MEAPSQRVQVKRLPERGNYDRAAVNAILDEALICHVGIVTEEGYPVVIPTIHARAGDTVYIHGSAASRLLRTLRDGAPVCVTVTLIDGLVLARAAFHHSMNYRSVVILGGATLIADPAQKLEALRILTERLVPGRWDEIRPPNDKELKATLVLSVPIDETSAKMRSGDPKDDEEDYALDVWAGVVPMTTDFGTPQPDTRLHPGVAVPGYLRDYRRP